MLFIIPQSIRNTENCLEIVTTLRFRPKYSIDRQVNTQWVIRRQQTAVVAPITVQRIAIGNSVYRLEHLPP